MSELQLWRNSGTKVARRAAQRIREGWPKVGADVLQGVAQRRRKGGAKAGAAGGVKKRRNRVWRQGGADRGAKAAQEWRECGAREAQEWRNT